MDGFAGKGHTVHLGILDQSTLFTETKYLQNVAGFVTFVDLSRYTVELCWKSKLVRNNFRISMLNGSEGDSYFADRLDFCNCNT